MNLESLEWLPIPNFERLYEINSIGQIRSLYKKHHHKILKPTKDRCGYLKLILYKNRKEYTSYVHRLMGFTFLPLIEGKNCINHINGIKDDNKLFNLEWVSYSENLLHANRLGLMRNRVKAVVNICTGEQYKSVKEASDKHIIPYATLKNMLNGNRRNKTCLRLVA